MANELERIAQEWRKNVEAEQQSHNPFLHAARARKVAALSVVLDDALARLGVQPNTWEAAHAVEDLDRLGRVCFEQAAKVAECSEATWHAVCELYRARVARAQVAR